MSKTTDTHAGGCLCGAIRYVLRGDPTFSAHCHCRSCQRAIGAGFVTWVGVKPDDFEVTGGAIAFCATSPGVQRGFCARCGSSLTFAGEDWADIGVTAASLDDPTLAKPTSNVYLDHRQPWVVLDDGLKKYDRLP